VFDMREDTWLWWKKQIKFWGITWRKEGIYHNCVNTSFKSVDSPDHIIKDGIVYKKPLVVFYFQENRQFMKQFNTFKDAKSYAENFAKDRTNLIEFK
jgi:hypothetical protein